MTNIDRPLPTGLNSDGVTIYNGLEVGAYRMARGLTVQDVANRLRMTQGGISHYMDGRYELQQKMGDKIVRAIDVIADERDRLREDGEARLKDIRAGKLVEPDTRKRARWRTQAEADEILAAQARGER